MPKRHRPGTGASSVLRHIEEIAVATSGHDAFELVFAIAAARFLGGRKRRPLADALAAIAKRHPLLAVDDLHDASPELLARVDALIESIGDDGTTLDAIFESLVPRLAKGDKGQFFTPRYVVEFVVKVIAPRANEVVVDPACGSGAFLGRARAAAARVRTHGSDVDARAVRVARLLALAAGADPNAIHRADGLHAALPIADVVVTNPPFAGRAPADGFDVARCVRSPERDVLFLERSLSLLRPGGRLGIVLPYNKANGEAFIALRRWLVERARVFAVVGLPRETFLPHTSQRTFVMFAKKREGKASTRERTMFVVSERAAKDVAGDPVLDNGVLAHDLDEVADALAPFLRAEGFA
jgi:type I restriction enzyme M protein